MGLLSSTLLSAGLGPPQRMVHALLPHKDSIGTALQWPGGPVAKGPAGAYLYHLCLPDHIGSGA